MDCIFCKISSKDIPSTIIQEDDDFLVIQDIHPKAPVHWLVIPRKKHIASVKDMKESEGEMLSDMILSANKAAAAKGMKGYKLVFNVGREGGQVIDHIHLHVLGG